jgi:hypothetical protein
MKNGNAITAMMQKKQCPTDPRGIFGVGVL